MRHLTAAAIAASFLLAAAPLALAQQAGGGSMSSPTAPNTDFTPANPGQAELQDQSLSTPPGQSQSFGNELNVSQGTSGTTGLGSQNLGETLAGNETNFPQAQDEITVPSPGGRDNQPGSGLGSLGNGSLGFGSSGGGLGSGLGGGSLDGGGLQ